MTSAHQGRSSLIMHAKRLRSWPVLHAECGGFFPWISWSMFLSANARPGNGGEGGNHTQRMHTAATLCCSLEASYRLALHLCRLMPVMLEACLM